MNTTTETETTETNRRTNYLEKVRKLLFQAEDAGCTPEEAKAFSSKAQSLMEKYSFSLLELEVCGQRQRDEIIEKTIFIPAPYAKAKQDLFFRIARANGVHLAVSSDCRRAKYEKVPDETDPRGYRNKVVCDAKGKYVRGGYVYLTGFRTDIENLELMLVSLLVQATNEVLSVEVPSWENTKSFRNSFFYGYSHAIGSRLSEVKREVQKEEVVRFQQQQGSDLLPVLASRKAQLDAEIEKKYRGSRGSVSGFNYSRGTNGYGTGRTAAGRADIGNSRIGSRKALGQ